VAVTAPRRVRAGGWSARTAPADLHAQPHLGQVYVRSIVRDQLRLALGVLAVLTVVLGGLPAAFALLPGLRTASVLGVRLAWLLLGVVAYPVLVGAAWFHVRHAERVERDFTELLGEPGEGARTEPGADPGGDPGSGPRTDAGPGADPGSGSRTDADPGSGSRTDAGPPARPGTGPGAGDGSAAGAG
jgi:hypothetical protein